MQDVRYNEFTTFGARAMVKGLRINKFIGNFAQELHVIYSSRMCIFIHCQTVMDGQKNKSDRI